MSGNAEQPNVIKEAFRPTAACLSADDLGLLLEMGPGPRRLEMQSHVDGCPRCRSELALLQGFLNDRPAPQEAADLAWITAQVRRRVQRAVPAATQEPWWKRWFAVPLVPRVALAAASLLVVLGVSVHIAGLRNRRVDPRSASESLVLRSQTIRVVSPQGDLSASPVALEWQAVAGATRYEVVVMEVDRNPIWKQDASTSSVRLPSAVREKALPGKTLLWQVVAFDRAGERLAASNLEKFRVSVR